MKLGDLLSNEIMLMRVNDECEMLSCFRRGKCSDSVSKIHIPFGCKCAIALQLVLSSQVWHVNDKRKMLIRCRRGRCPDSVAQDHIPLGCQSRRAR